MSTLWMVEFARCRNRGQRCCQRFSHVFLLLWFCACLLLFSLLANRGDDSVYLRVVWLLYL